MMKIKEIKSNRGFVILFAVTISAILLSIALGVATIALKEVKFSTSARDTNDAFFAADTAAECALFYDKSTGSAFPLNGNVTAINCSSSTFTPTSSVDANTTTYDFVVVGLGSLGQSCAKVHISKDKTVVPPTTTIISTGYSVHDAGDTSCLSSNTDRVEREIKIISVTS